MSSFLTSFGSTWLPWRSISMLGDSGLMIPMAIVIGLTLAFSRGTGRLAVWWTLFWTATGGLVLATKLAFFMWGIGSVRFDFTGLSGHAALASLIWPAAMWLLAANRTALSTTLWVMTGFLMGAAIAYSRWKLHAHSSSEAVIGFVAGSLIGLGFWWLVQRCQPIRIRFAGLAGTVLLVLVVVQHSRPTPTQDWIRLVSTRLTGTPPFGRPDLHRATGTDYLGRVPALQNLK